MIFRLKTQCQPLSTDTQQPGMIYDIRLQIYSNNFQAEFMDEMNHAQIDCYDVCWMTTSIQAPNAKCYDNAGSTRAIDNIFQVSSIRIDRDIRVIEVVRLNQCIAHEEVASNPNYQWDTRLLLKCYLSKRPVTSYLPYLHRRTQHDDVSVSSIFYRFLCTEPI